MPPLIKTNNQNYRCLNCQSPYCELKTSEDGVLEYYKCHNCGYEHIVNFRVANYIIRDHLNKISEQRIDQDGQF